MADDAAAFDAARAEAYSTPLDKIDVSLQDRFVTTPSGPSSSAFAARTRSTTALRASLGLIGQ